MLHFVAGCISYALQVGSHPLMCSLRDYSARVTGWYHDCELGMAYMAVSRCAVHVYRM